MRNSSPCALLGSKDVTGIPVRLKKRNIYGRNWSEGKKKTSWVLLSQVFIGIEIPVLMWVKFLQTIQVSVKNPISVVRDNGDRLRIEALQLFDTFQISGKGKLGISPSSGCRQVLMIQQKHFWAARLLFDTAHRGILAGLGNVTPGRYENEKL